MQQQQMPLGLNNAMVTERRFRLPSALGLLVTFILSQAFSVQQAAADDTAQQDIRPLSERFAPAGDNGPATSEVPSFQKHVSPLLGRLGCNGRACHGSFQGQGGFQLSLFGYDFRADYEALFSKDTGRVNFDNAQQSLILTKPTDADAHEGGKRFDANGWEYWVLRRWIESHDSYDPKAIQKLRHLEVSPSELRFDDLGQKAQLRVIACWEDGSREDVTGLSRFQSNDTAIAAIDERGVVTSGERGDTHVVVSYDSAVVPVAVLRPVSAQVDEKFPPIPTPTTVDQLVVNKLRKLGIVPSEICTDEEFLRRACLDVTGTLPTAAEVTAFCADSSASKRRDKIEELLNRPTYVAQWTTFLCDVTGNNDDQLRNFLPQGIDPSHHWYRWIYQRLEENVPYDQIVEGIVTAVSRLPNESYRDYCEAMTDICQDESGEKFAERPGLPYFWARNNFKTSEDRVIGFAYSFLGVRIQCAQCHKHPFDQWSKEDFENFERLFNGVQANQNSMASDAKREYNQILDEIKVDKSLKGNQLRKAIGEMLKTDKEGRVFPFPELVISSSAKNKDKKAKGKEKSQPPVTRAKLLGGQWVDLDAADVRGKLMEWLRAEDNPYFAKAIVNRVWAAYFGVGIVNPPDDLNLANAPSNAELLEYLASEFRRHQFDLKWLHREILNSDTYQRSWTTNESNALDKRNFSHSLLRRLPAEATHDAVRMALVNDSLAVQARDLQVVRAITRPGASSQAPRDDMNYALSVFGRSIRESNCDCDRSSEPSLLQTVFLLNDRAVLGWLSDPQTSWVASVAEKYGWPLPNGQSQNKDRKPAQMLSQTTQQLDKLEQQLSKADARLKQAEEKQQESLITATRQRREQLVKQIQKIKQLTERAPDLDASDEQAGEATVPNRSVAESSGARMTEQQAKWIAEQAYLRTLSRKPRDNEMEIALTYLRSENDPTQATENFLWSLVNTKEFIINH